MIHRRHLVLAAGRGDDVFDALAAALADGSGAPTSLVPHDVTAPARTLTHYVFLEPAGRARVVLVVDTLTPAQYVVVESREEVAADRLANHLRERLRVQTQEELRAAVPGRGRAAPGALVRLALAAEAEPDDATVAVLREALVCADQQTRLDAVEAASLTQWAAMQQPLERVRASDPAPEVRRFAADALLSLRRTLRPEGIGEGPE